MHIRTVAPWSQFVAVAVIGIGFFLLFKSPANGAKTSLNELENISPIEGEGIEALTQTSLGLPVQLAISSTSVDASVEYVGLTPAGDVGTPKNPTSAAWFNLSPRPGEVGNAVIVGHSGWKEGKPAVFDDLSLLRAGDKIDVANAQGETVTFVVRTLRTYKTGDDTSAVFKGTDGKAHLVLITCEGDWDKVTRTYSARLAIFADRE